MLRLSSGWDINWFEDTIQFKKKKERKEERKEEKRKEEKKVLLGLDSIWDSADEHRSFQHLAPGLL